MVKKNDPYTWEDDNIPLIKHHSKIKHKIINEYVSAYISTLMSDPRMPTLKLTLVDGFCGGGLYYDMQNCLIDGSPIILLETVRESRFFINQDRLKERFIDANYFFIDSDKHAINFLDKHIKAKNIENRIDYNDFRSYKLINQSFENVYPKIKQQIKDFKGGEHAIFILDQYGYKEVKMPIISDILNNIKNSEVILNFNIESMLPFFSNYPTFKKCLQNIGLDNFIDWNFYEKTPQNKREIKKFIQESIAGGIQRATGAKFMTLFFVKPDEPKSWGYWLVHLSNHSRAHTVMKNLHWENANYFTHELGSGLFEFVYDADKDLNRVDRNNSFDFSEDSRKLCIESLHEDLGKWLYNYGKPIPVGTLFDKIATNTPASEDIIHTVLKQIHSQKNILLINSKGRKRQPSKTYNKDDIIEPSPQITLIL